MAPSSPLSQAAGKYYSDVQGLTADEQKEFAQEQQETAPYRQKILDVLNSPNEAKAHLQEVAQAPNPEDYRKYSMQFFAAMSVLGALAGRFTRQGGTAALNAFSASIKGWQQGNLQAYEDATKQWQGNMEATLHNNQIEIQKYQEIMADKKANIDQMMAAMNIVAGEHQNKIMFDATLSKNYTMAFQAVDKMQTAQDKANAATDKLLGFHESDQASAKRAIDYYNSNPAELSNLNDQQYLALKGAAQVYGMKLADKPAPGAPPPGWTDQQLDVQADLYRTTGKMPALGFGAKSNLRQIIVQRAAERAAAGVPIDPAAQTMAGQQAGFVGEVAGQRAAGARSGNIAVSAVEADRAFQLARTASQNFPRGQFVPFNKLKQMGAQADSNPQYRKFMDANEAAVTAYGATMSRNGANTVAAQQRAHTVLDTADSDEAYQAGIDQLQAEVNAVRSAPAAARNELLQQYLGPGAVQGGQQPAIAGGNDGWGNLQVQ